MKNFTQTLLVVFMAVGIFGTANGQYTNPKTNYLILGSASTNNYDYIGYNDAGISGLTSAGVYHFQADVATGASVTSPTAGISIVGTYSPSKLKVKTANGYIDVGAQNSSWAHIYTDRPKFIFNKPVTSMNGFHSYNSNLNLEAASGYYVQIKPRSSSYGLILREYNSNDYGNIEVTSSGLGLGYNTSGAALTIGGNGNVNVLNNKTNSTIGLSDGTGNSTGKPRLILHQRNDIPHAFVYFNQNLYFKSDGSSTDPLVLQYDGSVGIGFGTNYSSGANLTNGYKLAVNGNMHVKSIDIDMLNWSDFVFESDYQLRSLKEVETFINENGHLPEIPSAVEVSTNGINVGEIQSKLLQKIEELTLYLIEMEKNNEALKDKVISLENQLKSK